MSLRGRGGRFSGADVPRREALRAARWQPARRRSAPPRQQRRSAGRRCRPTQQSACLESCERRAWRSVIAAHPCSHAAMQARRRAEVIGSVGRPLVTRISPPRRVACRLRRDSVDGPIFFVPSPWQLLNARRHKPVRDECRRTSPPRRVEERIAPMKKPRGSREPRGPKRCCENPARVAHRGAITCCRSSPGRSPSSSPAWRRPSGGRSHR